MHDDEHKHAAPDPKDLDINVKVGWVKGLNRLYFLYEAYDNYWDFADPGLHNDTFEIVVDGDRSGGPLIPRFRNNADQDECDAHFSMHGVQAQNYHIFTPSEGKDWALAWGCQPWDKELPWANHAQNYHFKPRRDPASTFSSSTSPHSTTPAAKARSAPSNPKLYENKLIGLSWAVIDYDGCTPKTTASGTSGTEHTMYGNATLLREFRLMPLEPQFQKAHRSKMDLQSPRHESPPRRLSGRVRRQDHQLALGLRRRHQFDRTTPPPHLPESRTIRRRPLHRRPRRQSPACQKSGTSPSAKIRSQIDRQNKYSHLTIAAPKNPYPQLKTPVATGKSNPKVSRSKTLHTFDGVGGGRNSSKVPSRMRYSKSMRIASLQPSITITLAALNRLDNLCACTKYCLEALPELASQDPHILHDSWTANTDEILAAKADLVIASVPYRMESLAAILKARLPVLLLAPHSLADIYRDIRLIAAHVDATPEAESLITHMQSTIASTRERSQSRSHTPIVYCEEWGKPMIHSQSWVAELVEAAGGTYLGTPGSHTTPEAIAAADPDILLFAWCGAGNRVPLERVIAQRNWHHLKAVRERRVFCIPDQYLNTPAHTLLQGLACIAATTHPQIHPPHPHLIQAKITEDAASSDLDLFRSSASLQE